MKKAVYLVFKNLKAIFFLFLNEIYNQLARRK